MSRLRALLLSGALFVHAPAGAAAPSVGVHAEPLFGAQSPLGDGWASVGVRLTNTSGAEVSGVVELSAAPAWSSGTRRVVTSAPFALAPKTRVSIELPTHGFVNGPTQVELTVVDRSGTEIAKLPVSEFRMRDPLLLDLSAPSRIAPALRGLGLITQRSIGGGYRAPTVLVTSPSVDPTTGDPMLPRWAASYANSTLVVTNGRVLGKLPARERSALADWVLAGGALAVTIDRPEDLRLEMLTALAGGEVGLTAAPPELLAPALFLVPGDSAIQGRGSVPGVPGIPTRGMGQPERRAPSAETRALLAGFTGGNLRPSPWGAVASYGLGELHLLAFDGTERFLDDRWTQLKLVDLVRHAWERQASIVLPLGQTAFDGVRTDEIRAHLDPNRTMRWTIVAAAVLLLVYAALAGPLNFWLAARQGKPLRALVHLPLWAGSALCLVVLLGVAAKGVTGHARRLTLIEAGAGMDRAAATRFRGLYASSSREIAVMPTHRSSLLDVTTGEDYVERTLVVDRNGARIDRLRTRPWATIVIREDGFASLAGGVSIVRDAEGEIVVSNRTSRDLVGVVLKTPGRPAVSFARIRDGSAVRERDGDTAALSGALPSGSPAGTPRPLSAASFAAVLNRQVEDLGAAWSAIEAGAPDANFWVDDVPVLIAELEGGERKSRDSGWVVDVDRVLLRVVGFGGVL